MKIQSTHHKSIQKSNKKKQTASTGFDTILQSLHDTATNAPTSHDEGSQPAVSPRVLASYLDTLEQAIDTLQSGEHDKAQHAIDDLRQALRQSGLAPQDREDADTLLAVEAKRLARLQQDKA